jgi:hypothetical protein
VKLCLRRLLLSFLFCLGAVSAQAADTDIDGVPDDVEVLESLDPTVKDNNIFTSSRLFPMQQYRDFLAREGDAGGITFYTNQLNGNASLRGNVIENFYNSPEFQGVGSPVARLYFAAFLRIPDYAGLIFQINVFRSGASLAAIANNFTLSPEFTTRYGSLTDTQYVTLLYVNILERTPVQAEVDFHVNRMANGTTRGEVLVGFSESPEYTARTANDVYVTMMYVGMLRRAPEQSGFDFWVNYMDAGNPGLALILGFLQSPEYHDRFLYPGVQPTAGQLVISEILADPAAVTDANGEWFEVYNRAAGALQLGGLSVTIGTGTGTFTITTALSMPAGAYFVFGRNGDTTVNGNVAMNVVYGNLALSNATTITLKVGGLVVDTFAYNSGFGVSGASMSLDPGKLDATLNDATINWCASTVPFGSGDKGTPGSAGAACP